MVQHTNAIKREAAGLVSMEKLRHFRCGSCQKWWTIGDSQIAKPKQKEWFCPWCGLKQRFNAQGK